jgi:hypothetical protein
METTNDGHCTALQNWASAVHQPELWLEQDVYQGIQVKVLVVRSFFQICKSNALGTWLTTELCGRTVPWMVVCDDKISTVYSGKGGIWHIQCSEVVHLLVSFSIVQRAIDELAWGA